MNELEVIVAYALGLFTGYIACWLWHRLDLYLHRKHKS